MLISEVSLEGVFILKYFITETTTDLSTGHMDIQYVSLGVMCVVKSFATKLADSLTESSLVCDDPEVFIRIRRHGTFNGEIG